MADNAWDQLKRALRQIDPLNTDGAWQLITSGTVNIVGGGSGGTSSVDNNPFTPGGTSITPIGGYFSGGGSRPLGSGNVAAVSIDASANLKVNVVAGGAGGGIANLTVRGSGNTDLHVGYVGGGSVNSDGGAYMPILGTVNLGAGAAPFASVAVYGSPANPIYAIGSVNVTNAVGIFGSVNVLGTVTLAAGAAPFASVAVYGSPANPVYIIGSANMVGGGGSLGVTQIGSPWGVVGSVGVTPLASFTVNLGGIPTVNLGLGTVNIGNAVGIFGSVNVLGSVSIGGVPVVDTRGSLVATTWLISFAGSGYFAVAAMASAASNMRTFLYAVHVSADNSAVMSFQSPSGSFLTGSIRIPGAAGWNLPGQLGHPLITGAANATLSLQLAGSGNVGGFAAGWIG